MSYNQNLQQIISAGIIWELNIVVTQPVGVPDPMGFKISIPDGERGLFLGGIIGPDNYGADRSVKATIQQKTTNKLYYRIGADAVDNLPVQLGMTLVNITEVNITQSLLGIPYMPFILTSTMDLTINGSGLINAETITGVFWIATRQIPPDVATVGASVTLTSNSTKQV